MNQQAYLIILGKGCDEDVMVVTRDTCIQCLERTTGITVSVAWKFDKNLSQEQQRQFRELGVSFKRCVCRGGCRIRYEDTKVTVHSDTGVATCSHIPEVIHDSDLVSEREQEK